MSEFDERVALLRDAQVEIAALRAEVKRLNQSLTLTMLDRKKERDEVHRLRQLADARLAQLNSETRIAALNERDAAKQRVATLEAAIEDAPHTDACPAHWQPIERLDYVERAGGYTCDCWKRDAMAGAE